MRIASFRKKFTCVGGPLHGHKLWLTADGATLTFTLNGQTGRYIGAYSAGCNVLWEAA